MCLYSGRLSGRCDERRAAGRDLLIENLILRQRLAVYTRQRHRPLLCTEERLLSALITRTCGFGGIRRSRRGGSGSRRCSRPSARRAPTRSLST